MSQSSMVEHQLQSGIAMASSADDAAATK